MTTTVEAGPEKFPPTFYYANAMELFERLAHYGFYIGLSLYLSNIVKMSDIEVGIVLGNWRLAASLAPIPCGAIADRITFKRSLIIAFSLYATAYSVILLFPTRAFVIPGLFLAALAGGFMKPVIWSIYATLGLVCALAMVVYGFATRAARRSAAIS